MANVSLHEFISTDGATIAYEQRGRGTPLVMVHGTTGDRSSMALVAPLLEDDFTLYVMDRRGRGASGDGPAYSLEREFEDVARLVDLIGGPVDLYGHSYGGLCALGGALMASSVRRLVLYEPAGILGHERPGDRGWEIAAAMDERVAAGDPEAALIVFLTEVMRTTPEAIAEQRLMPAWAHRVGAAHTVPREIRAIRGFSFAPDPYRALAVPTLLVHGSDTAPTFIQGIEILDGTLPNTRISVLDGHGHNANTTGPDLLAGRVRDFLQE